MPRPRSHPLKQVHVLTRPLTELRGVGQKRAACFSRRGLRTVLDLLFFTPVRYQDRSRFSSAPDLREGQPALVCGIVASGGEVRSGRGRRPLYRILLEVEGGTVELIWFHFRKAHLDKWARPGTELMVYGGVHKAGERPCMAHPEVHVPVKGSRLHPPGIHPVYGSVEGVPGGVVRSAVQAALDRYAPRIDDPVPRDILDELGLPSLEEALFQTHQPPVHVSIECLHRLNTPAQKRLVFDRFLLVMLALETLRIRRVRKHAPVCRVHRGDLEEVAARFPFQFTPDQAGALQDTARDLASGRVMSRIAMGDVGCGKTAVAAAAAHLCARNGMQTAVMAPTRLLAEQHLATFSALAERLALRPVLFSGALRAEERRRVLEGIRTGEANVVVGTHALVHDTPIFHRLGLAVIDEQQRFGVRDRARFTDQGGNPHLLVLTATPIPRTLARMLYGDMDISRIHRHPEGRKPVITRIVGEGEKRELAASLADTLGAGQQVIVVCPAVTSSGDSGLKSVEEMAEGLKRFYTPRFRVGAIHGRLPTEKRMEVMERFREGRIQILVATTVIEVGVDVPNATVMVVEHPERFGLAQLHQLRGRIGRGTVQGTCYLVCPSALSDAALDRLEALVDTADGFEIAERDMALRGQGELTGVRQAGVGEFDLEEILSHPECIEWARRAAETILARDPALRDPRHGSLARLVAAVLTDTADG
ncbi:MAG: ATP-dependent DNA helicase RecG [Desulfobacteraceae bacterium]